MASSEVDQKFLGKLARAVENDNPLLSSMLFKILGLSMSLSEQLVLARKQIQQQTHTRPPGLIDMCFHIIWLSREGLVMLEQYVLPMVGNYVELKVLAYKLRASFYHIFVLFHNQPPVSTMTLSAAEYAAALYRPGRAGKAMEDAAKAAEQKTPERQPRTLDDGGPVGPPPGFGPEKNATAFLMPTIDYLPRAHKYFQEAVHLAETLLWGSHSLRLSVKTEYSAFLYECVHDAEGSRKLAQDTISEVYDAGEGIDNDMFQDACELVSVLGKMMKRGLPGSSPPRNKTQQGASASTGGDNNPPAALSTAAVGAGKTTPVGGHIGGFI